MKSLTKRFVSSVLSVAMAISTVPIVSAHAEESTEKHRSVSVYDVCLII